MTLEVFSDEELVTIFREEGFNEFAIKGMMESSNRIPVFRKKELAFRKGLRMILRINIHWRKGVEN